jgi:hypothetical protein
MASMTSEAGTARGRGLPELSRPGDAKLVPSEADGWMLMRWVAGEGEFAGDDFWGEIDLARSAETSKRSVLTSLSNCAAQSNPSGRRFAVCGSRGRLSRLEDGGQEDAHVKPILMGWRG